MIECKFLPARLVIRNRNRLIAEKYEAGLTLRECADLYGVSPNRIRQIVWKEAYDRGGLEYANQAAARSWAARGRAPRKKFTFP